MIGLYILSINFCVVIFVSKLSLKTIGCQAAAEAGSKEL